MNSPTYYEILGVPPTADAKTIRKAYLQASLRYHPDKNPNNVEESKQKFVEIGRANEVLSDPVSRAAYDQELAYGRRSGMSGSTATGSSYNSNARTSYSSSEYASYEGAFNSFVAGLSEEEINAAAGAAAAFGSVIGSILGSKMGGGKRGSSSSSSVRSIIGSTGSLVGSFAASKAASALVHSVHRESVERVEYDQRVKEAKARGEPIPEKPRGGWDVLRGTLEKGVELAGAAAAAQAQAHAEQQGQRQQGQRNQGASNTNYDNAYEQRGRPSASSSYDQQGGGVKLDKVLGTAFEVASMFVSEMNNAKSANNGGAQSSRR